MDPSSCHKLASPLRERELEGQGEVGQGGSKRERLMGSQKFMGWGWNCWILGPRGPY